MVFRGFLALVAAFVGAHVVSALMTNGHPIAAAVVTGALIVATYMWARKW